VKRLIKSREIWLILANLALLVLIALRFPDFVRPNNLAQVFNDTSLLIILTLGQMVVLISRSLDLSMASNLCFSGMAVPMLNAAHPQIPVSILILIALAIGLALSALNGLVIWLCEVPPIVVTLGTLSIFRGATYLLSGGAWVNADQMSPSFIGFQRTVVLGVPVLSWIAIGAIVLFAILMRWTPFGRSVHAIGVNPVASVYAGIDVGRTKFFVFCIPAPSPGSSATCGFRATSLLRLRSRAGMNSRSSPRVSLAACRSPAEWDRWRARCWGRCFLESSPTRFP
jgi:rhamnose transport system permease protein